ncbi:hypothetical protein Ancab_033848 [Ancistrocladus abbreviatus]
MEKAFFLLLHLSLSFLFVSCFDSPACVSCYDRPIGGLRRQPEVRTTTKPPPPVKPPTQPPVKPPPRSPLMPPTRLPVKPPIYRGPLRLPTRKPIAVQGIVFCKRCNYTGDKALPGHPPLAGVSVVLKCNNTKVTMRQTAKTDKNGLFLLQAPGKITNYGAQKCRVYLASPPSKSPCKTPTDINNGVSGDVLLRPQERARHSLYTVGPFFYEPPKCTKP